MNLDPNKYVVMTMDMYYEILNRIVDLEKIIENIINSK